MAKTNEKNPAPKTVEDQEPPRYRFKEAAVDEKQIESLGLSVKWLKEHNLWDKLMQGQMSDELVPIKTTVNGAITRYKACISFRQDDEGKVIPLTHPVRQAADLSKPFLDHHFSEDDKINLEKTGHMGRVVPLKTREGWEDCFISIHPQTKQIMSAIAVNAKIYNEYCGVTLTPHEKNELLDGRAIFVEGMKTIKDGVVKEFDATLQYNACTRRVDFYFDRNSSLKYGQELGKIPLTNKQVDEYNSGKAIFLDGYVKKNGEVDSFFVRRDPDTGKMEFSRRNQDNPSEVYVPSQINGVTINADERETLRKGGHIYLNNMTSRDGNEYSAYVKLNPETGYPMTSRTLEGFEEKREFKIPQEINGVTLTANQRAELQDGKPVLIEGMRVNGGTPYSQWAQVSQSGNRLNWYNENPDKLRETAAARRAAQIQAAPVKRDQKEEQKKGRKVA